MHAIFLIPGPLWQESAHYRPVCPHITGSNAALMIYSVSMNKLMNKPVSCRRFERPWRSATSLYWLDYSFSADGHVWFMTCILNLTSPHYLFMWNPSTENVSWQMAPEVIIMTTSVATGDDEIDITIILWIDWKVVVTGGTGGYHYENLQCHQLWQNWHHTTSIQIIPPNSFHQWH